MFAAALLERYVGQKQNPVLAAVYAEVKAPIEKEFRRRLGPRRFRNPPKYIEQGNRMLGVRA